MMAVRTVTIPISEAIYQQAKRTAAVTSLSLEEVLAQLLALSVPPLVDILPANMSTELTELASLDDDELWQVARSELSVEQQERLEELTELRKERELSNDEAREFKSLFAEGQDVMVKKAESYRLLTLRGYTIPWLSQ
jgi:hypothetical protein